MDRHLFRTFSSAVLENGILTIPDVSAEELQQICTTLREAVLDYEIKHFKVIGVKVQPARANFIKVGTDYISKIPGVGASYVDIMKRTSKLIYSSSVMSEEDLTMDTVLKSIDGYVTSSNDTLFNENLGITGIVQPLINDVLIFDSEDSLNVTYLLKYGSKLKDFIDIQYELKSSDYVPIRQLYDLTSIFNIYPMPVDGHIKFMYKEEVNESVLLDILKDNYEYREARTIGR